MLMQSCVCVCVYISQSDNQLWAKLYLQMFEFQSKMELRLIPTFVKENKVWIKSSKHLVSRHLYDVIKGWLSWCLRIKKLHLPTVQTFYLWGPANQDKVGLKGKELIWLVWQWIQHKRGLFQTVNFELKINTGVKEARGTRSLQDNWHLGYEKGESKTNVMFMNQSGKWKKITCWQLR